MIARCRPVSRVDGWRARRWRTSRGSVCSANSLRSRERLGGPGALEQVGAQGVAQLRHRAGRADAVAGDVAEHHGDPAVRAGRTRRTSRRRSGRRPRARSARASGQPGDCGMRRQQAALQRLGEAQLALRPRRRAPRRGGWRSSRPRRARACVHGCAAAADDLAPAVEGLARAEPDGVALLLARSPCCAGRRPSRRSLRARRGTRRTNWSSGSSDHERAGGLRRRRRRSSGARLARRSVATRSSPVAARPVDDGRRTRGVGRDVPRVVDAALQRDRRRRRPARGRAGPARRAARRRAARDSFRARPRRAWPAPPARRSRSRSVVVLDRSTRRSDSVEPRNSAAARTP